MNDRSQSFTRRSTPWIVWPHPTRSGQWDFSIADARSSHAVTSLARTNCDCGIVSPQGPSDLQAVNSLVFAVGAFSLTDLMPFSMDDADEYISLLPMVWPLLATNTKYGEPSLAVLR